MWQVDFCPVCGGENQKCQLCEGTNQIKMNQCPTAQYNKISYVLEYYIDYAKHNVFPDGRGRFYQPKKLLWAFRMLDSCIRVIQDKKEKETKDSKNGK